MAEIISLGLLVVLFSFLISRAVYVSQAKNNDKSRAFTAILIFILCLLAFSAGLLFLLVSILDWD